MAVAGLFHRPVYPGSYPYPAILRKAHAVPCHQSGAILSPWEGLLAMGGRWVEQQDRLRRSGRLRLVHVSVRAMVATGSGSASTAIRCGAKLGAS